MRGRLRLRDGAAATHYNSHMAPFRLLPFSSADGSTNMAADEAMLESAAERGVASLRFYTWSEPTITLGYFQPASTVSAVPGKLPWVRRSTGGAAIVHHHELTYALTLPDPNAWRSSESWICRFHHLLRDVLAEFGIESRAVICGEEKKLGEVLCFLHQTAGDLLIQGSKVAGSAQRKRKRALLQHGSLLLSRSEFAPMPGINDFAKGGRDFGRTGDVSRRVGQNPATHVAGSPGIDAFTPQRLSSLLQSHFDLQPGGWTAEELHRTDEIRAEKYANPEWNAKR